MPFNMKSGNVELEKIHAVYLCLWNNDIAGFFKAINYEWSNNIAELMEDLRGTDLCLLPLFIHLLNDIFC